MGTSGTPAGISVCADTVVDAKDNTLDSVAHKI